MPNQNTSTGTANVQASFYSELMTNYSPETPVDARHAVRAVEQDGRPLVVSVGSDSALHLIFPKDETETGWVRHDVSGALGEVTAFDVGQDSSGALRLAVAVRRDSASHFYLSGLFRLSSLDLADFDPHKFWKEHTLHNPSDEVNLVEVDADGALIATRQAGGGALYYTVDEKNGCQSYGLPEDGAVIRALSLGTFSCDRGVFLLYDVGDKRTMLFQSFPDSVYDRTSKYRFEPPGALNDFTLLPGGDGNSQLYTVGDGVYLFTDPHRAHELVATAPAGVTFDRAEGAQHGGTVTLWLQGADSAQQPSLYYLTNRFYRGSTHTYETKWAEPLRMRQGVAQFACLRGAEIANHLFLVSQTDTLTHFYQDAASTLWKERAVHTHDAGEAREYDSYTLHVQFSAGQFDSNPAGRRVTVCSDAAVYVTLNGVGYQLGPQRAAKVPLDPQGALTVVTEVSSIKAPVLTVKATDEDPFLAAPISVDLQHKVSERLRYRVTSGDALRKARKRDGTPLLSEQSPTDDATLDHAANSVCSFLDAADHLSGKNTVEPFTAHVQFSGGRITHQRGDDARRRLYELAGGPHGASLAAAGSPLPADLFTDVGHAFGDFIHWLSNAAVEAVDFVIRVDKAVSNFIIKIGEQIYQFVVETAEQVFSAVEWVFGRIHVFFKDLVEWLGFLFKWEDILRTKHALKGFFVNILDGTADAVKVLRTEFNNWIEDVIANKLHDQQIADALKSSGEATLGGRFDQGGGGSYAAQADPRLHWANSKIHHIIQADTTDDKVEQAGGILAEVLAAIEKDAQAFVVAYDQISQKGEQLADGKCTIGEFAVALWDTLASLALSILKAVVNIILNSVEQLVGTIKGALTEEISIPLLSALYKRISGGDPLSMMDLFCLLLAIPSTIFYKITFDKAPFDDADEESFVRFPLDYLKSFKLTAADGRAVAPFATEPASLAAADRRRTAADAGHPVAHGFYAATKAVRVVTFGLLAEAAMKPTGGAGLDAPPQPGTRGLLVVDNALRTLGLFFSILGGNTSVKNAANMATFIVWFVVHGYAWGQQRSHRPLVWTMSTPEALRGKLGDNLNIGAMLDAASVTAFGCWAAALTHEAWEHKSDAARAADVTNEIFQIPAIFGFFANAVARNSDDSPPTVAVAALIAAIRGLALLVSSASEFAVAVETS